MSDWVEWFMVAFLGLLGLCVVAVIGVAIWKVAFEPKEETFALSKERWACTKEEIIPIITTTMVGTVVVPQTHYVTECAQWSRK